MIGCVQAIKVLESFKSAVVHALSLTMPPAVCEGCPYNKIQQLCKSLEGKQCPNPPPSCLPPLPALSVSSSHVLMGGLASFHVCTILHSAHPSLPPSLHSAPPSLPPSLHSAPPFLPPSLHSALCTPPPPPPFLCRRLYASSAVQDSRLLIHTKRS